MNSRPAVGCFLAVGAKMTRNQTQRFTAKFRKVCSHLAVQHGAFQRGLYRSCLKRRRLMHSLYFNKEDEDEVVAKQRKIDWLYSLVRTDEMPNKYAREFESVYQYLWDKDQNRWAVLAYRPKQEYDKPQGARPIEDVELGTRGWEWLRWNHVSLQGDPESSESDMDEQTVCHPPKFRRTREEISTTTTRRWRRALDTLSSSRRSCRRFQRPSSRRKKRRFRCPGACGCATRT